MIRLAILEYEAVTKEIVFQLAKVLENVDWNFRYYTKASELLKKTKEENFQIFIFDELFKTPRMESVFVHDNPSALFIYVCENPIRICGDDQRSRIIYINKNNIKEELQRIRNRLFIQSSQEEVYVLDYDGVHVRFRYEDIYYIEKEGKLIYFHTKKGIFHRRDNMSELEEQFQKYGFIRTHVSFLVNQKYIVMRLKDEIELVDQTKIPLSRSQKKKLLAKEKENRLK